jgi:hypothetical protein
MNKNIYHLYEKNFNQPTLMGVLMGDRVKKDWWVKSTFSKKEAEEWAKGEMKYYTTETHTR